MFNVVEEFHTLVAQTIGSKNWINFSNQPAEEFDHMLLEAYQPLVDEDQPQRTCSDEQTD